MKIQCKEKLINLKLTLTNLATNSNPSLNHLICGSGSAYTSQLKFAFDAREFFCNLGGSTIHLGATGKKHIVER